MVFAAIYFQYGIRNREEPEKQAQLNELSNKHYHWCLSKMFDLSISQTVTAVQALTLIAMHARCFPKPGCSSKVAAYALHKAIELNLHREVKLPGGGTNIENEVRKRVWWACLGLTVTLDGRLGRPMPIALEEFDTDFPLAIPDEYLSDEGVLDATKIGQCPYHAGLVGLRIVPLYMEMYSNIYSVRRDPRRYLGVVRALEDGVRGILASLPDEVRLESCKPGTELFALYCQAICHEFLLCLRHPSVAMTDDPDFCAENTRVCEDTARELLKVLTQLLRLKCLDTTWYQLAVYVAAIFSTLVAHWERRFDTTHYQIATLREEMNLWLAILYEIGLLMGKFLSHPLLLDHDSYHTKPDSWRIMLTPWFSYLGSGSHIGDEVSVVINRTIAWIEQDMQRKDSSPTTTVHQQQIKGSPTSNGKLSPVGNRNGSNGYYDANMTAAAAGYTTAGLPYGDQSGPTNGTTAGSYDHTDSSAAAAVAAAAASQYLYAVSAAAAAGTVATVDPMGGHGHHGPHHGHHGSVHHSGHHHTHANPLMAFASQAAAGGHASTPRTASNSANHNHSSSTSSNNGAAGGNGGAGTAGHGSTGNPWHDWTAAMAAEAGSGSSATGSTADRYGATTALLNLGGAAATDDMSGHHHHPGHPANGHGTHGHAHAAQQWPLLLFHDGTGTVSGA
jgi:hypothetical protein